MRQWFVYLLNVVVALGAAMPGFAALAQDQGTRTSVTQMRALELRDQDDRPFSLRQMLGTVTLLNFVYTGCGEQCPMQTTQLAAVQAALPAAIRARVQFISVSIDPEHDFPAALRSFAVNRGADLRDWRFLTGRPADIDTVADFFGARPPGGRGLDSSLNHSTVVQLFDAKGQGMMRYGGAPLDEERLVADLTYIATHADPAINDAP